MLNQSRRHWMKSAGIAGMGAISTGGGSVRADVPRVTGSEFGYRIKTFGSGETIRVGMIGNVGHTGVIIGDIPGIDNVELVAYAEKTNPNMTLPAGVRLYDTYDEMLDKEELDMVGICLPYYRNAKATVAAAKAGAHVMTEKPVATTLDDLAAAKKAVIENRVRLTALLEMRVQPRFQAMRESIGCGDIGEPILCTAQKSYKFGASRPDFYKDIETYGGTIPWVGIHAIDYTHYTTGLEYTRVAAFQGNMSHPDYPGCQDYVGTLFGMSNGGTTLINMDYLRPDKAPTHGDDRLRVIGSEGVIEIKDLGERVELITSTKEPYDLPLPESQSFMRDFISELRGGAKHLIRPEEPFEMTRVSLLARKAADEGIVIEL